MKNIREILNNKILIMDGAMGTAIQSYKLDRSDYSYEGRELTGCHEILNINRKDIIADIHKKYIDAGSDIIETNTFNANSISLREYQIENQTYRLAFEGAKLAKEIADSYEKKVWVAGSMGPTSKSASIPTKENPISREVDFDDLFDAYKIQAEGLADGGVDLFLIETIFDGLNAKAAVLACEAVAISKDKEIPIMISATVDKGGRVLSGQDMYSLVRAIDRDSILSFGLNCSFGAKDLVPLAEKLSKATDKYLSLYPNAGLPNAEGEYDEAPEITLGYLKPLIDNGKLNIIGGCCGTNHEHIKYLSDYSVNKTPRLTGEAEEKYYLSGSAALAKGLDFYVVGERNNVAGSRKFKRLIEEKKYEEALEISRTQIEKGAHIIDVNLDDALLEPIEMEKFLKILGNDAYTSKVPVMIDSSDFSIIEKALRIIPGRAIVNSISLKEGEEDFLKKAATIKKFGAAVVVMAFDEDGQAVSFENKIKIAERAYRLLTSNGWKGEDIVFDTNILTIGTGREEDRYHAVSFIDSVKWIKQNLPGAKTSGGISNLSFGFRGNNFLRKVIHQLFLERAIKEGLSMAIVNPGEKVDKIPEDLRDIVERLLDGDDVVDEILDYNFEGTQTAKAQAKESENLSVEDRLKSAILKGGSSTFDNDVNEALENYSPLNLIQTVLMDAMQIVGDKFEAGELYLPQIIRSASVMERAVAILTPLMEAESVGTSSRGKIQMCTVRGDVHDIGKNITGTVLKCNGYDVTDLGVMVEKERILEEAIKNKVDIVTLSGLITPSLTEMQEVAAYFEENGMTIPILIGGAATSRLHTSLKIEPKYANKTFHVTDASSTLPVVAELLGDNKESYVEKTMKSYDLMRNAYLENQGKKITKTIEEARKARNQLNYTPTAPKKQGEVEYIEIPIETLEPLMDWSIFLGALKVKGTPYEEKSMAEAKELLEQWKAEGKKSQAVYAVYPSTRIDDTIKFADVEMLLFRNQGKTNECLADYIEEEDYIGAFVGSITVGDNNNIIHQLLANTLAEATSEYLEAYISETNWDVNLRPAIGYPCLPDHTGKRDIFKLLDGEKTNAKLSPNFAMSPGSTVCGIYIGNPKSEYISPRTILDDQIKEMADIKGFSIEEMKKYLSVT